MQTRLNHLLTRLVKQRFISHRYCSNQTDKQEHDHHTNEDPLYEDHIPSSPLQKLILTFGSAGAAILDPYRDDMVAVFGETTGYSALEHIYKKMMESEEGRQILIDKPRINSQTIDMKALEAMPKGTLGHEYISFMARNNISADTRKPVKFIDDVELAYVMQRYREAHDIVHTIFGMPTNMLGEVTIKWIEAIQTDLPMCWSAGLFGAARLSKKQRFKYKNFYLPWALECGHKSKFILNVYFEKRWTQDLESLKEELNIPDFKLFESNNTF